MFAPITHILPVTAIRRERVLPVPGKVMVRSGQKVSATDIIAEADLSPEYILLDIARGLGVSADRSEKYLQVQAGDQVARGDMIAGPLGLARRVVRSPRDGRVILAGSGQVLIEAASSPFLLKAGISGEVVELVADQGALVETTGALIQGVWGNGQIDFGNLSVLAKSPDQMLTFDQLDVSQRGAIVLGACCEDRQALKMAEDLPLRGLILSSMSYSLVPIALKLQLPVILIEGFGRRPMNSIAFKLLTTNDRREVAVNAETWDRYSSQRPEVVISLPTPGSVALPKEAGTFAPDQLVRILSAPYVGKVGKISSLKDTAVYPNGLRAPSAEVRLESGEKAILPLANLEVLA